VKAEPLTHELVRLDWWCADARPSLRRMAARTLDDGHERLRALAATLPGRPAVLVHRDFYEENLLWDGRRLSVLDFDQLARGDPALDVAHFQVHLEALAYRRTGRAEAYAALVARFAQAAPPVDADRLRFYRAQTFVKIAATEVQRRRDGWRELAEAFTDLALRETERGAPAAPAQASTPTSRSRGPR
jgi:aminoglycoside phosphotransferase (APT) family kinase protein